MSFTSEIKKEIISKDYVRCCKRAFLAGFIRASGAIILKDGEYGFQVSSSVDGVSDRITQVLESLYSVKPNLVKEDDVLNKKERSVLEVLGKDALNVLTDLNILNGNEINLSLDGEIIKKDCCKKAFISGVFLGSGSAMLPIKSDNGYHFEFSFTQETAAEEFFNLLKKCGLNFGRTTRKGNFILYIKNKEAISDILAFMGLSKAALKLTDIIISKDISNTANRQSNCDVANLKKQISARDAVINAIKKIESIKGLDFLPKNLKEAAVLRQKNPDDTLLELSQKAGVSKSGLNHRLNKITEIAKEL